MGTDEDYIFVIRLWREPGTFKSEEDAWRGQVTHKEQRRHFVGLPKLFVLIRRCLGLQDSSSGQGQQH